MLCCLYVFDVLTWVKTGSMHGIQVIRTSGAAGVHMPR